MADDTTVDDSNRVRDCAGKQWRSLVLANCNAPGWAWQTSCLEFDSRLFYSRVEWRGGCSLVGFESWAS